MYSIEDFLKMNNIKITSTEENNSNQENNLKEESNLNQENNPKEEDNLNQENNPNNEIELMRGLYSKINTHIYHFVSETLKEYEFSGSFLYDEDGIDRERIAQIVDKVIKVAHTVLDEIAEIKEDIESNYPNDWTRMHLLRSVIESIVLNEIFMVKRAKNNK